MRKIPVCHTRRVIKYIPGYAQVIGATGQTTYDNRWVVAILQTAYAIEDKGIIINRYAAAAAKGSREHRGRRVPLISGHLGKRNVNRY